MGEMLQLMAAPLAACVVLMGIHVYLGLHVIQRRLIFVDLALAQIAALGATMGFLLGFGHDDGSSFLFSLGFAVGGAAIFTATRMRRERVPQEAIIGTVYVVALASSILIADQAPEGAEHIKETLVGSILWVTWPTIFSTAAMYVAIGAIHVALRERFLQISFDPEGAYREKRWIYLWDFVFYTSFAFVITSAVAIAGVLLVFSFLVIPAVVATLFATRVAHRLVVGWGVGIVACLAGLLASYRFDIPSGPTVVAALGLALVVAATAYLVLNAGDRPLATLTLFGVVAPLVFAAVVFFAFFRGRSAADGHEDLHGAGGVTSGFTECGEDAGCIASRMQEWPDWPTIAARHLGDADPRVRERMGAALGAIGGREALSLLAGAAAKEADPLLRLEQVRILIGAGDRRGFEQALDLLGDGTPPLIRDDAHRLLCDATGQAFGYDPFATPVANAEPLRRWAAWIDSGS